MYYINLTEIFRERHLALLREADNRRLARRLRAAKRSTQGKGMGNMRRPTMLFAAAVVVAALIVASSAVAFAAARTGTDNPETLIGTIDNDKITGKGGNDLTVGKKGNDTYFYQDGWGLDPLIDSGGTDTLDFSAVTTDLTIYLCPELKDRPEQPDLGGVAGDGSNAVFFQKGIVAEAPKDSKIERAKGGSGDDTILGCTGSNRLSGGGGLNDTLVDYGGFFMFGLPDSSDTYVVREPGSTRIGDLGGKADVLDMRAFRSQEVQLLPVDFNDDGEANSLGLIKGTDTGVLIFGQFGTDLDGHVDNMRIESIKFKDKTISPKDPSSLELASSTAAERSTAASLFGGEMPESEDLLKPLEPSEVL